MDARNRGYLLALLGVFIFALTLPVTKFVVGTDNPSSVSPVFTTYFRGVIAGVCSIGYLFVSSSLRFPRALLWPLLTSAAGTVVGFPLLLGMGLVGTTSTQGAVVTGFLPIATAVMMSLCLGKQQNLAFWVCALIGVGLIATFSYLQGDGSFRPSDLYLMLAVLSAAAGYVAGAKASEHIAPSQAICWILIVSLPLTLPMTVISWPDHSISVLTWAGLGYLGTFSMWLGFFAWYKGMNLAGPIAASQVQLLQPFIALFLSSLLLGEQLDALTIGFAIALIATLIISKRLSLRA